MKGRHSIVGLEYPASNTGIHLVLAKMIVNKLKNSNICLTQTDRSSHRKFIQSSIQMEIKEMNRMLSRKTFVQLIIFGLAKHFKQLYHKLIIAVNTLLVTRNLHQQSINIQIDKRPLCF